MSKTLRAAGWRPRSSMAPPPSRARLSAPTNTPRPVESMKSILARSTTMVGEPRSIRRYSSSRSAGAVATSTSPSTTTVGCPASSCTETRKPSSAGRSDPLETMATEYPATTEGEPARTTRWYRHRSSGSPSDQQARRRSADRGRRRVRRHVDGAEARRDRRRVLPRARRRPRRVPTRASRTRRAGTRSLPARSSAARRARRSRSGSPTSRAPRLRTVGRWPRWARRKETPSRARPRRRPARRARRCHVPGRDWPMRSRRCLRAQPFQAPGEQPRDVHLADADALGDLGLGQALEEPQLDDAPLTLGKHAQQLGELVAVLDARERRVVAAEARRQVAAFVVGGGGAVQRHQAVQRSGLHRLEHVLLGDAGAFGNLGRRRRPALLLAESADDATELEMQLLHASRHPDGPPAVAEVSLQLPQDRRGGEGRELEAAGGVEALDRLEQADERDLDQVVAHRAVAGTAVDLEAMVDPAVAVRVGRDRGAGVPAGALGGLAVRACARCPHVDHQELLAANAAAR